MSVVSLTARLITYFAQPNLIQSASNSQRLRGQMIDAGLRN